jgi:hypothetical protein
MPLQTPEFALTLTEIFPDVVGVRFAGVHVRPIVTLLPLQVAVGTGEIAVPTVPVVAVIVQAKVGAELLLEKLLLELPDELDDITELLLETMRQLLLGKPLRLSKHSL